MTGDQTQSYAGEFVMLVDYDNAVGDEAEAPTAVSTLLNKLLAHALAIEPSLESLRIRLYGGWMKDGVFSRRASIVQSGLGSAPAFPVRHPRQSGLLRGNVELVTRLRDVSHLQWSHTLRNRSGLPRVSLSGRPPTGCTRDANDCPMMQLHKLARRPSRVCTTSDCQVTNRKAYSVPEQKMVDVLMACDLISYAREGGAVAVISSDLDLLPAVAASASYSGSKVALLRSLSDSAGLYEQELEELGVEIRDWES